MKLCTVVHRVSLLLVVCDQSPTLWGTTFGQFELLSAHRADELAPNRDQVKFVHIFAHCTVAAACTM